MEEPFIKDGGLFFLTIGLIAATLWLAWATIKMFGIMRKEFELKTKPKLAFKPIQISCNDWNSLQITQTIINIGHSYATIDDANLNWEIVSSGQKYNTRCSEKIPIVLAPTETCEFKFLLDVNVLSTFKPSDSTLPTNLISGEIEYKCKGLDELEHDFIKNVEFQQHN
ncbi:MAG: hypothetical protein QM737_21075 [Ferruginibacter sp.]